MKRRSGDGWWLRWWGVTPDAHTPTLTNYHCVIGNKEKLKTEAPWTQMRQFALITPENVTKSRIVQVTSNVLHRSILSDKLCPSFLWHHGKCHWPQLCKVRWYTPNHCTLTPAASGYLFLIQDCPLWKPHLSNLKPTAGQCQHPIQPFAA